MKKEVWKDVKDFEGLYQISNFGRIKSLPKNHRYGSKSEKILKPYLSRGYETYTLYKDKSKKRITNVGRLVLETFVGNNNKMQCNHKNGIKTDNTLKNLEWVTASENCKHRDNTGLRKYRFKKHTEESKEKIRKSRLKNSKLYNRNKKGQFV